MKNNGDAFVLLISHSGGSSFVLFFLLWTASSNEGGECMCKKWTKGR